jgi:alpha-N-arabinofuranosidase
MVLRVALNSPTMPGGRLGDVSAVDAVATHDEETGALTIFAVNRSTEEIRLDLDLRAFPKHRPRDRLELAENDPHLINTEGAPDRVVPHTRPGGTSVVLPPVSWHALSFEEQS